MRLTESYWPSAGTGFPRRVTMAELLSAAVDHRPEGTALVSFSRYDRTVVMPSANPARAATARTIPSYMAFVL